LNALVKAGDANNDTAEIIYDTQLSKLKEIPRENIIAAVLEIIRKRKNVSAWI
jgi:hypothetical protein